MLKLHKRFPLGNTGLALRVVYDCPLEELDHALEPPARLLVRSVLARMQLSQALTVFLLCFSCVSHTIKVAVQRRQSQTVVLEMKPVATCLQSGLASTGCIVLCHLSFVLKYEVVHQLVV